MLANKRSINEFVKKWSDPGLGHEESDTQTFWEDLLEDVLGIKKPRSLLRFEYPVHGTEAETGKGITRSIDVYYPDKGIVIEQKSRGVDLDAPSERSSYVGPETPYQQAFWYRNNLPANANIRWIIVCNFDEIRIHDLNLDRPEGDYETVLLKDLGHEANRLSFISDDTNSRIERERRVSIAAGEKVVELYHRLSERYLDLDDDPEEQHSLNVLIVRLVFLLFAEDAGLFPKDALYHYLYPLPPGQLRMALTELFEWLDTPPEERDPYEDGPITAFPYVDGGLFDRSTRIKIPSFDVTTRLTLVEEASRGFDWSEVSPTIFGAVFESTLNPETRRGGGMHYTSIENIHKVIDPLFLDSLRDELDEILVSPEGPRGRKDGLTKRQRRLHGFQDKLASIRVLDPACGSGNFLTESYLELRRLENRVIAELYEDQTAMEFEGEAAKIKVSIDQFFGIEINDFAVSVARTALWIAEQQMMEETSEILRFAEFEYFPLSKSENIVCADALAMDWGDVLPADECDYVIGNPPFVGARMMARGQKAELRAVFGKAKGVSDLDYVAAWFRKGVGYAEGGHPRLALVATNSIAQGVQVAPIWGPLTDMGYSIDFCHDTFRWDNEASDKARVFCVIIGFSKGSGSDRVIYHHRDPDAEAEPILATHINGYLRDGPDLFVWDRTTPLSKVSPMRIGCQPIDYGNYVLDEDEYRELMSQEPGAKRFAHPFMGAEEFLHGERRWVLWFGDATEDDLLDLPLCRARIENVRLSRSKSKRALTRRYANMPERFCLENLPDGPSILVPKVSSERRKYVPIGFIGPETFCSDLVFLVTRADFYQFGVLQSGSHNAWMRAVAGRLEGRYRYSVGLVYNNFVWPEPTKAQHQAIESAAEHVLEVREQFPTRSLAKLYDPKSMPASLKLAHTALDEAVLDAYGLEPSATEDQVVNTLIGLYRDATQ